MVSPASAAQLYNFIVRDYQYNIGDVVKLNDDNIGLILSLSNACDVMGLPQSEQAGLLTEYMHLALYKVIINSTVSYIEESNIKELVLCQQKNL